MRKYLAGALGLSAALVGCASGGPEPTEHLAQSMAAVRGAETAGASQVPQAALHLKLAQEQIELAQQMIRNDDNERADAMTIRAFNDAELALALAREAQMKRELSSYAEAHPELEQAQQGSWQQLQQGNPNVAPVTPAAGPEGATPPTGKDKPAGSP